MHQMANGELPFRDVPFDFILMREICNGLRPEMPSSAPEPYKELAAECCDANPDKRPTARDAEKAMLALIEAIEKDGSSNNVYKPHASHISRSEKEFRYTSKVLPQGDLPEPTNSCEISFSAGMKKRCLSH